jgi:hypothetical protein
LELETAVGLLRKWKVETQSELETACAKSMVVLKNFAKAHHLLTLKSRKPWSHGLKVEYGWVDSGRRIPLTDPNDVLNVGQYLYITMRNTSKVTLFVSIFDLLADNVVLVSNLYPSGIEIAAGGYYEFGTVDFTGELVGSELDWPQDVPQSQEIHVAEVLVITDNRIDLRSLETDVTLRKDRGHVETELEDIVEQIGQGGDRIKRQSEDSYKPLNFGVMVLSYKLATRERSPETQEG